MSKRNLCIDVKDKYISPQYTDFLNRLSSIRKDSIKLKRDSYFDSIRGKHIARGKFSNIYLYSPNKNKIIRESYFFDHINNYKNNRSPENIKLLNELLDDSHEEPYNIEKFSSSLYKLFPHNILTVEKYFKCQHESYFKHGYVMNRIIGQIVDKYIEQSTPYSYIVSLYFQLMYIILYANMNGIFHNDIKEDNIMIEIETVDKIELTGVTLDNKPLDIVINNIKGKLPVLKLIDYGLARYTNKTNQLPIELNQVAEVFHSLLKKVNHKYTKRFKMLISFTHIDFSGFKFSNLSKDFYKYINTYKKTSQSTLHINMKTIYYLLQVQDVNNIIIST